jgi:hypothetical protein
MADKFTPGELDDLVEAIGISIFQPMETQDRLSQLSDGEISALLFYHVMSDLDAWTPRYDLVNEAVRRLNGGEMPFDEEGEVG